MIKQNYADRKELQDWYGKKILKELPDVNSNNILTKENMHLKDVVEMVCSASVTELCDLLFLPRKVLVQKYRTIKKYDELCVFTGYHKYWEKRVRSQFPGQRKKQKEERKKRDLKWCHHYLCGGNSGRSCTDSCRICKPYLSAA